jgi:hypothetical protein
MKLTKFGMLVVLSLTSLSCGSGVPSGANFLVGLKALQEGLKEVQETIQQASEQTKDRVSDASARVDRTIKDINNILTEQEKNAKKDVDEVMMHAFLEANDTLFNASLALEDAGVDFNFGINNAIVNTAQLLRDTPFLHIRPFIAMVYPTRVLPGASDYQIELLGFFRPKWGLPVFTFEDGSKTTGSMGADNRLRISIPSDLVTKNEGKRIKVHLKYPIENGWFSYTYDDRDLWITVLPKTVISYKVLAEGIPPTEYDYPQLIRDANTEAGQGEHVGRDITWSFHDLTGGVDFNSTYDESKSIIQDARIIEGTIVGNNPQSQNGATASFDAGKAVLSESAQGKGPNWLGSGGAGANVYAKIAITLKLARRMTAKPWHLKGNGKEADELSWGQNVLLEPDPLTDLTKLTFELYDNTFDPPQQRVLSLNQPYRSKYVTVEPSPQRINITVNTLPRNVN